MLYGGIYVVGREIIFYATLRAMYCENVALCGVLYRIYISSCKIERRDTRVWGKIRRFTSR